MIPSYLVDKGYEIYAMTVRKEQGRHSMESAADVTERFEAFGLMDAVKETGAFGELMCIIDRGQIHFDGKDGHI